MRRVRARAAHAALARAEEAARWARIPALVAEVEQALAVLDTPAARLVARGEERPLLLAEIEALLASNTLVIDACRNLVRARNMLVPLAKRPVLFALARALGEAWPGDVPRKVLLARAFGAKHADESHRARLRVEIGRAQAAAGSRPRECDETGFRAFAARRLRGRRAGAAGRGGTRRRACLPRRRRVVAKLRACARARHKPAHGSAGARLACRGGQSAGIRPRPGEAMDDPAAPGIRDDVVAPGAASGQLSIDNCMASSLNTSAIGAQQHRLLRYDHYRLLSLGRCRL